VDRSDCRFEGPVIFIAQRNVTGTFNLFASQSARTLDRLGGERKETVLDCITSASDEVVSGSLGINRSLFLKPLPTIHALLLRSKAASDHFGEVPGITTMPLPVVLTNCPAIIMGRGNFAEKLIPVVILQGSRG